MLITYEIDGPRREHLSVLISIISVTEGHWINKELNHLDHQLTTF